MIGDLCDLSRRPGMPGPSTLRSLIRLHPDFPVIERGRRGVAYKFDLELAEAFVRRVQDAALREGETRVRGRVYARKRSNEEVKA